MTDKKVIHIFSVSVFAVLLLALLLPFGESGRIVAAVLLLPAAVLTFLFIKKRNILSINKNQVLLIVTAAALVFVMIYYLTGLKFGFYRNPYRLTVNNFFKFFLPIAVVIVSTEVIRWVMMAQRSKVAHILCYFSCVMADMLIYSNIPSVTSFNRFMELIAGALFPALISNFLFNYLSGRYGMYPNIAYRAILTLHSYVFAVESAISESLVNLFNLFIPIALYLFIDALYENKRKYALGNISRTWRILSKVLTFVCLLIMIGTIMLISNQFRYGSLVIATESMTGEIDKGDAVIFERYEDQMINEGQIIVFDKNGSVTVHRVVDIQTVNGVTRYFTKGDANEDLDIGFVSRSDIIGIVNYKIPYMGYPTLWLRSLFKR